MILRSITTTCFLAATLAILPAATKPVAATADTAQSLEIMKDLDVRANDAADQAAELQGNLFSSDASWEIHAQRLQALKDDVNEMGRLLARLDEVRSTLGTEDREVLDRAAAVLKEMAGNTTAAVQYLNVDQQNFWTPTYRKSVNNLVNESSQLSSSVSRVIALDKTRAREKHLEKSLEQ